MYTHVNINDAISSSNKINSLKYGQLFKNELVTFLTC